MSTTTLPRLAPTASAAPLLPTTARLVMRLLPAGVAAMLVVDWMLGDAAEYYDAFGLVQAWGQVITTGGIEAGHEFIMGQSSMGAAASLAVGTVLLVVEPAVALAALVLRPSGCAEWSRAGESGGVSAGSGRFRPPIEVTWALGDEQLAARCAQYSHPSRRRVRVRHPRTMCPP